MVGKYRDSKPQLHKCNKKIGGCGEVVKVKVSIHKPSGVSGFTCPICGKTQEPYPVD